MQMNLGIVGLKADSKQKSFIDGLYRRRNQIAHQSDRRPNSAEKIPIKAPYGLYYLVKDDEKIRKWKRSQAQKIISGIELAEKKKPTDYKYTPSPPLTLNSITEAL